MHPSTWRLLKEEGFVGFVKLRTLHGYVYLKWIKPYVKFAIKTLIPRIGPGLKRYVVNRYHCKVLTGEEAKAVITVDKPIELHGAPEQMIPFPYVRDIVIKWPHDIAIMECCCPCCCSGNKAMRLYDAPLVAPSGYAPQLS